MQAAERLAGQDVGGELVEGRGIDGVARLEIPEARRTSPWAASSSSRRAVRSFRATSDWRKATDATKAAEESWTWVAKAWTAVWAATDVGADGFPTSEP